MKKTRNLLRGVASKTGLTESKAREVYNAIIEVGKDTLCEGDPWHVPEIGRFTPVLEGLEVSVVFEPYVVFLKALNASFVENREIQV